MRVKIERIPAPSWMRPLIPVAAVLMTFALTAVLVVLVGADPFRAYYYFLVAPLSSQSGALEVLVKATPLLLTGAAVAFAFTGGYWNIGAEGQLYAGATAATAIGLQMHGVSSWLAIPLMILGGFAAGMLWALAPALMKVKLSIDEVVTTLLLNSVAIFVVSALLNGPWRDPISQWPQSPEIAPSAVFPRLIARSRLHFGFVLAVVTILVLWFVLTRTRFGLRMRATGLSMPAARFAGVRVERTLLTSALVSGGIAGSGRGERGSRDPVSPHRCNFTRLRVHGHHCGDAGRALCMGRWTGGDLHRTHRHGSANREPGAGRARLSR